MSARNPFSKFSLKPSSLSQHTVNFNKILEEVPSPKIESIVLEKPKFGRAIQPDAAKTDNNNENTESDETKELVRAPASVTLVPSASSTFSTAFVFGESLTDRVINTETTETNGKENGDTKFSENTENSEVTEPATTKAVFAEVDAEKYNTNENDVNTLIRMNCKLFVLDKDQKDQSVWTERGYGVLKIIDSEDGLNSKIMMWTDKCFRLVLNTKLFEKMVIEKVNRKSIRLNAQDEGKIKNFLIKCGHPNEGEELANLMIHRLKVYKEKLARLNAEISNTPETPSSKQVEKEVVIECECDVQSYTKNNTDPVEIQFGKLTLYKSLHSSMSGQQHLLIDICDIQKQNYVQLCIRNQYLKSIKLVTGLSEETKGGSLLEFEIKESFSLTHKVTIKNPESAKAFLKFYEQEQILMSNKSHDTSLNDDSLVNETSSDDEEEENASESTRNSNTSRSLESSLTETNKSENEGEGENVENKLTSQESISEQPTKKRKPDEDDEDSNTAIENANVKKMSLQEKEKGENEEGKDESSVSLKRNVCGSSQESSQEYQSVKKTKVTEDEV